MKKILLLSLLLMMMAVTSLAQNRRITGVISDRDTKESVMQVTVQLLKTDSTFVNGTISNEEGRFSLTAPQNGNYLLKLTSVGYKTQVKQVNISDGKNVNLGTIVFEGDAIMLKGLEVTGQAS